MVVEVSGVTHKFGDDIILEGISFAVDEHDRMGIVGYNGCGKTTLLNIITNELTPTEGSVRLKEGATIGYQRQVSGLNMGNTVFEEMKTVNGADMLLKRMKELEKAMGSDGALIKEYEDLSLKYEAIGGYELDYMIRKVLNGMSFKEDSWLKKVGVLSGGERTRLAFAKLLISRPDVLILDEPTNHLDSDTLEWLEGFLSTYNGAVMAVSHDRWFLDAVSTRIVEIINHKARLYKGNYSSFLQQREFADIQAQKEYKQKTQTAEKLEDYVRRNIVRASTSKMAKSRLKMLGRMDLEKPENLVHERIQFDITPASEPFKEVAVLKDITIIAGERTLADGLSFVLLRGERLAVVGPNGSGKTTLINVIAGKRKPESGSVKLGGGVKMAYLAQNLFDQKTSSPINYIWDRYPAMTQFEVRSLLAAVGFQAEEVFLDGYGLSGGELARLGLARISLEHPNLLVLDEPTNHLDIYSKDILTGTLERYSGTMIVVSHDRYLLSKLNAKILLLDGMGSAVFFETFSQYRGYLDKQKSEQPEPIENDMSISEQTKDKTSQKDIRRQSAQLRQRVSFLESSIEKIEKEIAGLEAEAVSPETISDHVRLKEIYERLDALKELLAEQSDEWLRLSSEL